MDFIEFYGISINVIYKIRRNFKEVYPRLLEKC